MNTASPSEMGYPATYTFEQFVEFGRRQVRGEHGVRALGPYGMPWSFNFQGHAATHENNERYIVEGNTPGTQFNFTPAATMTVHEDGTLTMQFDGKDSTLLDVAEAEQAKKYFAHIEPTIGGRVWFHPDPRSGASNFHVLGDQPMDASIVFVWGSRCVNLDVADHAGVHHSFTSVTLLQPGDANPEHGQFCRWMPFQIGQAKAQEQLPAHHSTPISVRVGPYTDAERARARPLETKSYTDGTKATGTAPLPDASPAQEGPRIDLGRYAGTYGGYLPDPPPTGWQRLRRRVGGWIAGAVPQ